MKYLLIILLSFSIAYSQDLSKDQKEILRLEILRTKKEYPLAKEMLLDSTLIYQEVYQRDFKINVYRSESEENRYLTSREFEDIFGSNKKFIINTDKKNWKRDDFINQKVAFYTTEKFTKILNGQKVGVYIGAISFPSLGVPIVRSDRKYAVIQWATEHYGDSISIYKKVNGEWKFYKTFSSMNF